MAFDVDRLLRLWTDPLPDDDAAAAEAFRGPLSAAAGPLAPTGQHLQLRVIDVLTLTGGRISAIAAAGAVRLPLA